MPCRKRRRVKREVLWKNLYVTDIMWAPMLDSQVRDELGSLGATMTENISCFDYMNCLKNMLGEERLPAHGFDVCLMFGFNFGVFGKEGELDLESNVAAPQYAYLPRSQQQRTAAEAMCGQDLGCTNIMIHSENNSRYFVSSSGLTYLKARVYNPGKLRMLTGMACSVNSRPLIATCTGPSIQNVSKYLIRTAQEEEQLDVFHLILDTLANKGCTVLGLAAGRFSFWGDLLKAFHDHLSFDGCSSPATREGICRPPMLNFGKRTKCIGGRRVGYVEHCCMGQVRSERAVVDGVPPIVGRVDYSAVREWSECDHVSWQA
jgi:hypothetical protein